MNDTEKSNGRGCLYLILIAGVIWYFWPASSDLKVHILNVGQADAIYIECPDGEHQLVIDSGDRKSLAAFCAYFKSHHKQEDTIETIIATHNHADHIGGMPWLLENYAVKTYIENGISANTAIEQATAWQLMQRPVKHLYADPYDPDFILCPDHNIRVTILLPDGFYDQHSYNLNNYSIVVRVDYDEKSFLFTGDAERPLENLLLDDPNTEQWLNCDFLKVGHHGSNTSSSLDFIHAVSPSIAAISSGDPCVGPDHIPKTTPVNTILPYTDPRDEAIEVDLYDKNTEECVRWSIDRQIYFTREENHLLFICDGKTIRKE